MPLMYGLLATQADQLGRDLVEPASRDVEHEAAQRLVFGDERARLDPPDGLTHILGNIDEGFGGPFRLDADLVLDLLLEPVVGEGQHAAVGVVNENDLSGAE